MCFAGGYKLRVKEHRLGVGVIYKYMSCILRGILILILIFTLDLLSMLGSFMTMVDCIVLNLLRQGEVDNVDVGELSILLLVY